MILSVRDIIATLFATIIFGLYFSITQGYDFIFISGYREGIIAVAVIGVAMCLTSHIEFKNIMVKSAFFVKLLSCLGFFAIALTVYGLIASTQLAFIMLSILILLMWMLTTFHNLIFE